MKYSQVPHEFADFAILMRGLKFQEALPLQIGTALTGKLAKI